MSIPELRRPSAGPARAEIAQHPQVGASISQEKGAEPASLKARVSQILGNEESSFFTKLLNIAKEFFKCIGDFFKGIKPVASDFATARVIYAPAAKPAAAAAEPAAEAEPAAAAAAAAEPAAEAAPATATVKPIPVEGSSEATLRGSIGIASLVFVAACVAAQHNSRVDSAIKDGVEAIKTNAPKIMALIRDRVSEIQIIVPDPVAQVGKRVLALAASALAAYTGFPIGSSSGQEVAPAVTSK